MTLLRQLTFLLGSQTVTLTVLLFWGFFFPLVLVLVLQWFSLILLRNPDHVVVSVSIDVLSIQKGMPCFVTQLITILMLIGTVFVIIKPGAFAAGNKFSEYVHVLIDVYITHHKYQVKRHSSPSPCCCHNSQKLLFSMYHQNKSCKSKVRF